MQQVELWEKWIRWEIEEDPLVLKDDETAKYKERVVYVFKQAVMALRFWPRIWYDAAEFCFQNGMDSDGNDFLTQGIAANPESCLLAFKKADRAEMVNTEDGGNDPDRRRKAVREPYEKLLEALYELSKATVGREAQMITRIQEEAAQDQQNQGEEDDLDAQIHEITKEAEMRSQTETIKKNVKEQVELLKNIISHVWIAKMRAMRRVEGKGTGKAGDQSGLRGVFAEARKYGQISADFWLACALMEYHCYKDPAATRIFERGLKLFPENEQYALEHLKHLIAINDATSKFQACI